MRDFVHVLCEMDNGRVNEKMTEGLCEVVQGVRETGKVGKIKLELAVKKEGDMIIIRPIVKADRPSHAPNPTMYFAKDDGSCFRDNPVQPTLKNIDMTPRLIKKAGDED